MDTVNQYIQTTLGDASSDISGMFFQWLVVPSLIFMITILAVYTWRAVNRHRVDKAIFEIRDTLREMNVVHGAVNPSTTGLNSTDEQNKS